MLIIDTNYATYALVNRFEYFDIGKRHDEETIKPNFDKFKTEMIHVLDSYVLDHGLGNMYYRVRTTFEQKIHVAVAFRNSIL